MANITRFMLGLLALLSMDSAIATAQDAADEAAISARLERLQNITTPSAQEQAWVSQWSTYREHSNKAHPEHPGHRLPRYQIQAKAKRLLTAWSVQAELKRWRASAAHRLSPVSDPHYLQARRLWLQEASLAELAEFRAGIARDQLDEQALQTLALRQQHTEDWKYLAQTGQRRSTLSLLATRLEQVSEAEAAELLNLALRNPKFSGPAATLRGQLARSHPQIRADLLLALSSQHLDQLLMDAALQAQLPELIPILSQRLNDPTQASWAAYGLLRLQEFPAALAALQAYQALADGNDELSREISQWLD